MRAGREWLFQGAGGTSLGEGHFSRGLHGQGEPGVASPGEEQQVRTPETEEPACLRSGEQASVAVAAEQQG